VLLIPCSAPCARYSGQSAVEVVQLGHAVPVPTESTWSSPPCSGSIRVVTETVLDVLWCMKISLEPEPNVDA
jgi:hypothetical protein